MVIEYWLIVNLNSFGNTLVPNKYIDSFGIQGMQNYLSNKIGRDVIIREVNFKSAYAKKQSRKDIGYIADIV